MSQANTKPLLVPKGKLYDQQLCGSGVSRYRFIWSSIPLKKTVQSGGHAIDTHTWGHVH